MNHASDHARRIVPVQALRIVAALAVTVFHAELMAYHLGRFLGVNVSEQPLGLPGAAGVDLFFAISGFVMVVSSERLFGRPGARALFLKRRLIRIVPLYWIATLVLAAWMLRFGPVPDIAGLVRSMLFLPFGNPINNGRVSPLLEPGWTLNFEMQFYALFALVLGAGAGGTVARIAAILVALVAVGHVVDLPQPLRFWTQPILLEFAAGAGLALLYRRGVALPGWLRLALMAGGIALLALPVEAGVDSTTGWERVLHYGPAGLLLLAAAVLGPLALPAPRLWDRLGDMSYALYLWHLPLMTVVSWTVRWLRLPYGVTGQWLFIGGTVAASLASAWVIHSLFERPVTHWLNRRLATGNPDRNFQTSGI